MAVPAGGVKQNGSIEESVGNFDAIRACRVPSAQQFDLHLRQRRLRQMSAHKAYFTGVQAKNSRGKHGGQQGK
jgi:hypothetical protein